MRLGLDISEVDTEYFEACARIRNITATSLLRRIINAIARDQMVASVLDDDDLKARLKGEHRYRKARPWVPCCSSEQSD
jgi:hypothetical protein